MVWVVNHLLYMYDGFDYVMVVTSVATSGQVSYIFLSWSYSLVKEGVVFHSCSVLAWCLSPCHRH